MTIKPITYFDNNATTQVSQGVLEAMLPFYRESYGNPSASKLPRHANRLPP